MKAVIDGGDAPDLILFATTYEGRDVVGPPVGQARPHGAHQQHRHRRRRRHGHRHHRHLRRQHARDHHLHRRPARTSPCSGRSRSPPRRRAAAPAEVGDGRRPRPRRHRRGQGDRPSTSRSRPGRSSTRPPSSSPAGVASARPGKYEMIEQLAKLLKGGAGRVPGHRRRRLGALLVPGRPDRQGREADRLHRRRHLAAPPSTWWA